MVWWPEWYDGVYVYTLVVAARVPKRAKKM
jgi:hypothetical protein